MHPDPSFPALHRLPHRGWINDPNGLALVDGRYHVFFQFNPDSPHHGSIHWGHVSSSDLVRWREEPIALAPRPGGPDEAGCWSGSFVDEAGTPTLLYSGVDARGPRHAAVVIATGDASLREWTADPAFVPGSAGPRDLEVRDPFLFQLGDTRYAVQGAAQHEGPPRIEVYRLEDLRASWTSLGPLVADAEPAFAAIAHATAWECPNLFQIGDTWVLLVSPLVIDAAAVAAGEPLAIGAGVDPQDVWWFTGTLDDDTGVPRFRPERAGRLDEGTSLYAPQVLVGERVLMWAWLIDVDRPAGASDASGWSGCLSLPRELTLVDGVVRSTPAAELVGLRQEPIDLRQAVGARAFELEGDTGSVTLALVTASGDRVEVYAYEGAPGPLRVLVDGSVIEVFEPDGTVRSMRAYPEVGSSWTVSGGEGLRGWLLGEPAAT